MIPLRDSVRRKRYPLLVTFIIGLNAVIFLRQLAFNQWQLEEFFYRFGAIPANYSMFLFERNIIAQIIIPLFSAQFLHGSWMHIISNMWFLWVFGDNVEDKMGGVRFIIFYLLMGLVATIAHIVVNPTSSVPIIGASGALAGVLGAYFVLYPRSRVLALVPIFFFFTILEIRAVYFLAFWFVLQLFSGVLSLGATGTAVAWWAHIGGFVAGAIFAKIFTKKANYIWS